MIRLASTALAVVALLAAAATWFPAAPVPPEPRQAATPWRDRAVMLARDVGFAPGTGDGVATPEALGASGGADRAQGGAADAAPPPLPKPAAAPEPVPERRLEPPSSLPFDDGMREQPGPPSLEPGAPPALATAPDQEEWAGLIRRMLAIYQRVGATE